MGYLGNAPARSQPAYKQVYEYTATAGQTTFSASYTPGFIEVYRNGIKLGAADFTATNGSSVVLASGVTAGDFIQIVSEFINPVLNAIPNTENSVTTSNIANAAITTEKIASAAITTDKIAAGAVVSDDLATNSVTTDKIANTSVTLSKLASTLAARSVSNATAITVATTTPTAVASVTVTTSGKPVLLIGTGDGNPNQAGGWHRAALFRGDTQVSKFIINENAGGVSANCPFAVCHIDSPSAGTYTYSLRVWQGSGSFTFGEENDGQAPTIVAVEIL